MLILEDGTVYPGRVFGAEESLCLGEVVFNTSMSGYQEILTDPSYKGQIVTMTCPLIGNYGVNDEDVEHATPCVEGFVVREISPLWSNYRGTTSLQEYFRRNNLIGIEGVDTRALTRHIRFQGALRGAIAVGSSDEVRVATLGKIKKTPKMEGQDLASLVTCQEPYEWTEGCNAEFRTDLIDREVVAKGPKYKVAVLDFGVKLNILRSLVEVGCELKVFPAQTSAEEIMAEKPDGVFLSNGPGDPAAVVYAIDTVRELLGKVPIFGICLGHQILALALGAKTYKLKFGHRGANHPVKDLTTDKIEITVQNHGFAVDPDSLPKKHLVQTHINLNDRTIEGLSHKGGAAFSVQYHPEASPGPHDSTYLFMRFRELMNSQK